MALNREHEMTRVILLLALSLLTPAAIQAQVRPDSIKHRNDCRLMLQVLTTGQPANKTQWALLNIHSCPDAGRELAAALSRSRFSADTVHLSRITAPADWLLDGELFGVALDVLQDQSASIPARVLAVRVLMWTITPGFEIGFQHLIGTRSCSGIGPSLHGQIVRQTALPHDWIEQSRAVAHQIAATDTEPREVQNAAACLALRSSYRINRMPR